MRDVRKNFGRGDLLLAGVVALITLIAFTIFFSPKVQGIADAVEKWRLKRDIKHDVELAQSRLQRIDVIPGGVQIVGGPTPLAQYTVAAKASQTFMFDPKLYVIEFGNIAPSQELCRKLDELENSAIPPLEALRNWEVGGSIGIPPVEVNAKATLEFFVELAYLLRSFSHRAFSVVEVQVKGYADGTFSDWKMPLRSEEDYHFTRLQVLPQLDRRVNTWRFGVNAKWIEIPEEYQNQHLANLRAAFVQHDIVEPMLETCLKGRKTSAHILEGLTFSKAGNPQQRRVEVYLNIY